VKAIKVSVVIPEDREMRIVLPPEVRPGAAEVIVLTEGEADQVDGSEDVFDFIASLPPGDRSKEDIDGQVREEREGWGSR
jgi:hypothetical protein